MKEKDHKQAPASHFSAPSAKYLSSSEIDNIITLLLELRDVTLSRGSFAMATNMIAEIGGAGRLPPGSALAAIPQEGVYR